jgi:hypothetical protein
MVRVGMSKQINTQRIADRESTLASEQETAALPLWQSIVELGASIPPEEWDRVPADLAANLDRYLYEGSGEDQ